MHREANASGKQGANLTISGGSITGNTGDGDHNLGGGVLGDLTTDAGGGIFLCTGSILELSGDPVIKDNIFYDNGPAETDLGINIYAADGATVQASGALTGAAASIGLTTKGTLLTGQPGNILVQRNGAYTMTEDDAQQFFYDAKPGMGLALNADGDVVISGPVQLSGAAAGAANTFYGTFDQAVAAITSDSGAGGYTLTLRDDRSAATLPTKPATITGVQSGGGAYTLTLTGTPSVAADTAVRDIHFSGGAAVAAGQTLTLSGAAEWTGTLSGQSTSRLVLEDDAHLTSDGVTVDTMGVLTMTGGHLASTAAADPVAVQNVPDVRLKTGAAVVSGAIALPVSGTDKITLLTGSTAGDYTVTMGGTPATGHVVFDGAANNLGEALALALAKRTTVTNADLKAVRRGSNVVVSDRSVPAAPGADEVTSTTGGVTVDPSDANLEYAVVEKGGSEPVANGGWTSGNGGSLTFQPLDPGKEYEVIVRVPADAEIPLDASAHSTPGADNTVPVINGGYDTGNSGKTTITVNPTTNSLDYAVTDGSGTVVGSWTQGTGGEIVFDNLDPNKEYHVVTRPNGSGSTTGDVVDKVYSPGALPGPTEVTHTSTSITIDPSKNTCDYAILDKTTGNLAVNGGWTQGNGGALVFSPLDSGHDYEVLVRTHDGNPADDVTPLEPSAGVTVKTAFAVTFTKGDHGEITAGSAVQDVDDGNYAAAPTITPETGWTFLGWAVSGTANIVDVAAHAIHATTTFTAQYASYGSPAIHGDYDDMNPGKITITVNPTDPKLDYAVTDEHGTVVGNWQTGNNGELSFDDLNPNQEYHVVVRPNGSSGGATDTVDTVLTPGLPPVSGDVAHTSVSITVKNTLTSNDYAILDKTTGTIAVNGAWTQGNGGDLIFQPLESGREYEVLVRTHASGGARPLDPPSGTPVKTAFKVVFDPGTQGTIPAGSASQDVEEGQMVSSVPTVTPGSGYRFDSWQLNGADVDPATRTITANTTFTARYSSTGGGGSSTTYYDVRFKPGSHGRREGKTSVRVASGNKVTVAPTVTAEEGWTFLGWSLDGKTVVDPKAAAVRKDLTCTALYEEKKPDVPAPADSLLKLGDHSTPIVQGDDHGRFRPEAPITRAEVAVIFFRALKDQTPAVSAGYPDVDENAWYAQAMNKLTALGILTGFPDGTARPDAAISRGEFAAITARFGEAVEHGPVFPDVAASHWAYGYIGSAAAHGWVKGYSDGTFRPEAPITWAEATVILVRLLERWPDKDYIDAHVGQLRSFPDVEAGYWAYYEIMEAANSY